MSIKSFATSALLILTLFLVGFSLFRPPGVGANEVIDTEKHRLRVLTLVEGLEHPWGLAFLPDGRMLVTERPGRLRIIAQGQLAPDPVSGLPEIVAVGQGGLLDVVLHPDFAVNKLVYISYAGRGEGGIGTDVARGRLVDDRLEELEVIFRMEPKTNARQHFGSRLVFDRQGYLYITLGDRGERERSQRSGDHAGSVIRLHDDGRVPDDNPFVDREDWKPEIYSYGHRNIQGAALHPESGALWTHEHGPRGGDEVNIIRAGRNYGWPVFTHGEEYVTGRPIGAETPPEGIEPPLHYWVPVSIAPSGMAFYTGDQFPNWRGDLFIGALRDQMLVRLRLDGEKVVQEEHLLEKTLGRIRDVRQGPDGYLYLLTDERNGALVRLEPAEP
ncbi:Glucose/arabinose dehydrogenase, beta-propeller fold [Geoalkalibacter ferrihydriticus]|uniref:Glucose/arabinose dehydrogenase, beta-propeller fold n=1 Tax=Geoalkalibacter ferrihydriticus TaxID=392333 RepID=A0A1G9KFE1_9BACT|nr:PQQ-dependent sugar dehydrogenase [Geoalkalibacter ferrihydriticus]SDL48224.1 Glucose/arabinose dehydrogenase, beta-propeller fold [Geoalkalibacter ferrihydriticus]